MFVGSGLIYGDPEGSDYLAREDSPMHPTSPYAASKAAADLAAYQYFRSHAIEVVRARPFNHVGPRQSPGRQPQGPRRNRLVAGLPRWTRRSATPSTSGAASRRASDPAARYQSSAVVRFRPTT